MGCAYNADSKEALDTPKASQHPGTSVWRDIFCSAQYYADLQRALHLNLQRCVPSRLMPCTGVILVAACTPNVRYMSLQELVISIEVAGS